MFIPTCSTLGDLQSSICGPVVSPVSKNTFVVCCLLFGDRGAREYGSIDPSHLQAAPVTEMLCMHPSL